MSCNRASSFPTVATVIGLNPQTLGNSGTFVATIAVDPNSIIDKSYQNSDFEEIKADDPITQALVDNINGNLPLKKEPEIFRCELCNISVSKKVVLDAHLIGIKHAKKVKSLELIKEINSSGMLTPSVSQPKTEDWRCNICNISVNSSHQLHAHIQGTKHKAKANSSESNMTYVPAEKVGFSSSGLGTNGSGMVGIDVSANRNYCAACNVKVNSEIQLHQHIMSKKHLDKVNGKIPQQTKYTGGQRNHPYRKSETELNFGRSQYFNSNYSNVPISNNFIHGGQLY